MKYVTALFIVIILAAAFIYTNQLGSKNIESQEPVDSQSGFDTYTNEKYGLEFRYPSEWRVGENNLERGTAQFYNYSVSEANEKSIFPANHNKIGVSVGTGGIDTAVADATRKDPRADYIVENAMSTRTMVGGQEAVVVEVDLVGGQKYKTYYIPLKSDQEKFASFVIFGDPSNFHILDELVQTIVWTK